MLVARGVTPRTMPGAIPWNKHAERKAIWNSLHAHASERDGVERSWGDAIRRQVEKDGSVHLSKAVARFSRCRTRQDETKYWLLVVARRTLDDSRLTGP